MLISGYFERKKLNKTKGQIIGFIFFFLDLFGYIYYEFLYNENTTLIFINSNLLGFLHILDFFMVLPIKKMKKNRFIFNILDLISKCFVGIFFWAYFTVSLF